MHFTLSIDHLPVSAVLWILKEGVPARLPLATLMDPPIARIMDPGG